MTKLLSTLPPAARTVYARLRERWLVSLVGIVALVLAAAFGIGSWLIGAGSSSESDFATRNVVNRAGGYRMTVPEDWQSTTKNTSTQLVAPDKKAIVTAGIGPRTPLPEAGATFFQQVSSRYTDVQVLGVEARPIGGAPARVWAAIGTNDRNDRIRFLAITIKHKPAHFVIAVRAGANSDPAQIMPRVNEIVGTFEALKT